ncbi:MAG: tRNA (adenosine(37)-N6)-threonylcarbamoyltransferase complex ATPase subunit type 1 TsaE [Patescibacteria group bacterium]
MPKLFFQISFSSNQTKRIAKFLASRLFEKCSHKNALVLALIGDLGSGKTTFIQGFARAMGVKKRITSPTFVIVKSYKSRREVGIPTKASGLKAKSYQKIYHLDCYRIKNPKEILDLEFKKIVSNPENVVLIEWADKIKKLLPKKTIWLNFSHGDKDRERIIKIKI